MHLLISGLINISTRRSASSAAIFLPDSKRAGLSFWYSQIWGLDLGDGLGGTIALITVHSGSA